MEETMLQVQHGMKEGLYVVVSSVCDGNCSLSPGHFPMM